MGKGRAKVPTPSDDELLDVAIAQAQAEREGLHASNSESSLELAVVPAITSHARYRATERLMKTVVRRGEPVEIRRLLGGGADVNKARPGDGRTPLNIAARGGYVEVVRVLLDAGADMEKTDCVGYTPLYSASFPSNKDEDHTAEHAEVVSMLLDRGANFYVGPPKGETFTLLHMSASLGRADLLVMFLDAGADVNYATDDDDGLTPLFVAASLGQPSTLQLLLDRGADVNKVDKKAGCTPLYKAAEHGHLEVARLLIESGACVNIARREGGSTPLAAACQGGHWKLVCLLLDHGAVETACSMPCGELVRKVEDVTSDAETRRLLARKRCAMCDKLCNVKKCGRCRRVLYCSRECQQRHWHQHKSACTQ
jgi:ankyrin repeat protein